jgi:hypothetical protein
MIFGHMIQKPALLKFWFTGSFGPTLYPEIFESFQKLEINQIEFLVKYGFRSAIVEISQKSVLFPPDIKSF